MSNSMPFRTVGVEAEVFMKHGGITVYRTYKDDDIDQGPQTFWFVLDAILSGDDAFDVRELATWKEPEHPPYLSGDLDPAETERRNALWDEWFKSGVEDEAIKAALRAAIDQGLLKQE